MKKINIKDIEIKEVHSFTDIYGNEWKHEIYKDHINTHITFKTPIHVMSGNIEFQFDKDKK